MQNIEKKKKYNFAIYENETVEFQNVSNVFLQLFNLKSTKQLLFTKVFSKYFHKQNMLFYYRLYYLYKKILYLSLSKSKYNDGDVSYPTVLFAYTISFLVIINFVCGFIFYFKCSTTRHFL